MKERKFDDALRIWDANLVDIQTEDQKLLPTINKARCLVGLLQKHDAIVECNKVERMIRAMHGEDHNFKDTRNTCDDAINKLIDELQVFDMHETTRLSAIFPRLPSCLTQILLRYLSNQGSPMMDLVFSLIRQRFQFLKLFFTDDETSFLHRLKDCGLQMENMFKKVAKLNKKRYLRKQLWIMEDILEIMQNTSNVDLTPKFVDVASVHQNLAGCYNEIMDYREAIFSCKKSIVLLNTAFATEASHYKVLSFCYACQGQAMQHLGQNEKASSAFQNAIQCANSAKDWKDVEEKLEFQNFVGEKYPNMNFWHEDWHPNLNQHF